MKYILGIDESSDLLIDKTIWISIKGHSERFIVSFNNFGDKKCAYYLECDRDGKANNYIFELFDINATEVKSLYEKTLGYYHCGIFPQVKTLEDLYKILQALEKSYDKNHRPIK